MGNICRKANINSKSNIKEMNHLEKEKDLSSIEYKDTSPFSVPLKKGKVVKVYDGDTITVANCLPIIDDNTIYRFSVRLNGIDTPEIKGKNEDEKTAAKNARDALSSLILHKEVILKNVSTEKYGRLLADVYFNDLHLNQWMIDQRYAVKYDGGHKTSPDSWLNYKTNG